MCTTLDVEMICFCAFVFNEQRMFVSFPWLLCADGIYSLDGYILLGADLLRSFVEN